MAYEAAEQLRFIFVHDASFALVIRRPPPALGVSNLFPRGRVSVPTSVFSRLFRFATTVTRLCVIQRDPAAFLSARLIAIVAAQQKCVVGLARINLVRRASLDTRKPER